MCFVVLRVPSFAILIRIPTGRCDFWGIRASSGKQHFVSAKLVRSVPSGVLGPKEVWLDDAT